MTELSKKVQDHYNKVGLLDAIADILKSKGLELEDLQVQVSKSQISL